MNMFARSTPVDLQDPPLYRALFASTAAAPIWLIVRTYVGWQWLHAGWGKVSGEGWITENGRSLEGFWSRIVQLPEQGSPPIRYDWYRDFIQFMLDNHWATWFAWVIAFGELFLGIALIVGLLTGLAALGGITLNFNFMLAGTVSTNPVLFLLGILLLLAWKVAGRIGIDRWLLPALGTPWEPGAVAGVARANGGRADRPAP
ncbi:MAG: DoxX family membrane protein [Chloroflexi bacterium]|nr:DoxX family membrane protein [Chloroflexota bacterium]